MRIYLSLILFASSLTVQAQLLSPQGMTLQGTIIKSNGQPQEGGSVAFTIQIRSAKVEDCLLYQETHTLNMTNSGGVFSLVIGSGGRAGPGFQATSTLAQVFNNASGQINSLTCVNGTSYAPVSGDARKVVITFNDGSGPQTLSDTLSVQAVPYALYSDTLQGKDADEFIQVNNSTAAVTQTNLESVFANNTAVTNLVALINGTSTKYVSSSATEGAQLPSFTSGSPPASPTAGDIWYNSTTNSIEYYNGSITQTLGAGGGGETNTASNQGSGGVGMYISKSGVDLQFKNINAGSNRIAVSNDAANKEVDIDVNEANFTLGNLGGTLGVTKGGTGSTAALNNNRVMVSSGGNIVEGAAITASRALASDANGIPVATSATATELGYISGVTSAIQTQLDSKQASLNFTPVNKAGDNMTGALTLPSNGLEVGTNQLVVSGGNVGIGTSAPTSPLHVVQSSSGAGSATARSSLNLSSSHAVVGGSQAGIIYGQQLNSTLSSSVNASISSYLGLSSTAMLTGTSGTVTTGSGISTSFINMSNTNVVNGYGISSGYVNLGTTGSAYGISTAVLNTSGAITNAYGIYTGSVQGTNKWSIYSSDANAPNYFAGNVGIGTISPGEKLEVLGAIKIGNATGTADGTIRFTGTDIEARIGGAWVSLSSGGGGGEANTASNQGAAGVGVFSAKNGVDLEFKNINAGSSKVTVTNDAGNKEIDIDISEGNLTLGNLGGTLGVTKGGTGSTAALNNNRVMVSSGGNIVEASAITASRALASDANGIPVATSVTNTELSYLSGVTSAIQTQLDGKQASLSYTPVNKAGDNMTGTLTLPANGFVVGTSQLVASGGKVGVGTSSPSSHLQVVNSAAGTDILSTVYSSASNWDAGSFVGTRARGTSAAPTYPQTGDRIASFASSNAVSPNAWSFMGMFATENWTSGAQGTAIRFYTLANGNTTSFPRMTVDHTGNVGIGTISPGEKLEVLGAIKIGNATGTADGTIRFTGTDIEARIGGAWVSLSSGGGGGEANTASNQGAAGVGVFSAKNGVDLEFKNINAGSSKVTVTNDAGNKEIDIDISESNLTLGNLGGTLGVTKGGTGSTAALNNNRVMVSSGGNIVEASAITANRALSSNASGIPVASSVTDTELGYLSGVTSAIQTQLDGKQASLNFTPVNKAGDNMTGTLTLPANGLEVGTNQLVATGGGVGVGRAPIANTKLAVQGAAVSTTNIVATGATVDLALSNNHLLKSPGGTAITLQNPVDGGNYTIIVSDTTSRTYTFTGCTNQYFSPANNATANRTTYTIMVVVDGGNTDCYVTWVTGFN